MNQFGVNYSHTRAADVDVWEATAVSYPIGSAEAFAGAGGNQDAA